MQLNLLLQISLHLWNILKRKHLKLSFGLPLLENKLKMFPSLWNEHAATRENLLIKTYSPLSNYINVVSE